MNAGFRGTRIGINSVTLSGTTISYEIAFIGEDMVTHGLMRHTIPLDANPEIAKTADALITMLIARAAMIHFAQPTNSDGVPVTQKGSYGIAEALGHVSAETDEPDGAQG